MGRLKMRDLKNAGRSKTQWLENAMTADSTINIACVLLLLLALLLTDRVYNIAHTNYKKYER